MDLLLRLATARNLFLLLASLCALAAGFHYRHSALARYSAWRYPPQKSSGPLGAEILAELEKKDRKRVESLYAQVSADLDKARAEGFTVLDLEGRARIALSLNEPRTRAEAERLLNEVRRDIPVKAQPVVPITAPDAGEAAP